LDLIPSGKYYMQVFWMTSIKMPMGYDVILNMFWMTWIFEVK
jgi:hypothetical protein